MSTRASSEIVLAAFDAVEQRDEHRLAELYHPEVEFHWPPSLPYGGSSGGAAALQARNRTGWDQVWDPLQPTEEERPLDPRVVAATGEEVVVLWHQRGLTQGGPPARRRGPGPIRGPGREVRPRADVLLRHHRCTPLPPAAAIADGEYQAASSSNQTMAAEPSAGGVGRCRPRVGDAHPRRQPGRHLSGPRSEPLRLRAGRGRGQ